MNSELSLYELNNLIKGTLKDGLPDLYWVSAETSDVRENQNGHCYLEFIEKDRQGRTVVARSRAMIWSNIYYLLKAYFEGTTAQTFTSGIKVLVQVSVEFHELYGFSLTVHDINPAYTLGDQAINRAKILKQLEEEGVLGLNKELEMPLPANRIAIISSPTAAGYEDFCDQLSRNAIGFRFYTKLFPAIMQGDRAESSIIAALEHIYEYQDCFDVVVIIRGGGATSELSCFDSYLLAANCAQFPLPVITGIGHERDETVLDIVAHTRAKTPTAVAEFLIDNISDIADELIGISENIVSLINDRLKEDILQINTYETQIIYMLKSWKKEQETILSTFTTGLNKNTQRNFLQGNTVLTQLIEYLKKNIGQQLKDTTSRLGIMEKHLSLISPQNILQKGYTLTLKDGKALKSVVDAVAGDEIITLFVDGEMKSQVK